MKRIFLYSIPLFIILFSCRKQPDFNKLSDNFVVATNIDTAVNFSSFKTYYISDTLALLAGNSTDTVWFDDGAKQLVNAVKNNLTARGFTYVDKDDDPDIGINMGAIKTADVGVVYPGWWWGYPGWWDPWYWGWDYPYYYPWSVAYVINTGTIVIDMVDLKDVTTRQQLKVVWTANMSGALGNNQDFNLQNGVNAINQAFTQSPLLVTK